MIYHLFPGNKEHHVPSMIEYFRDNCSLIGIRPTEQSFVIFGTDEKNISAYGFLELPQNQITFYPNKSIDFHFLKGITTEDSLIIHSVFFRYIWLNLLFWPKLWKRTAIVNWGAGFAGSKSIKGRINALIRRIILPKLGAISTLTPSEFDSISKLYGPCNNYVRAIYSKVPQNVTSRACPSKDNTLRVLLGNSAWESNNHIEVLKLLQNYQSENINVVCPLGYPSHSSYKDEVVDVGRKLLGDKFQPIVQMISKDEYDKLLDTIDVFVLNARNQQALYNVYYCLFQGKKVYIPKDSPTYLMLADFDIKVYETLNITKLSFDEFRSIASRVSKHNIEQAYKHFSIESSCVGWKELLSRIGIC